MWLDPYYLEPLGLDTYSYAALQARALLSAGKAKESEWAEIAARSRRDARRNPNAQVKDDVDAAALLREDYVRGPLRPHACRPSRTAPPPCSLRAASGRGSSRSSPSGSAASTTASTRTTSACATSRIHRRHGSRRRVSACTTARSTWRSCPCATAPRRSCCAARSAGAGYAVNPSGGPLCGHPVMATGLVRVIEVGEPHPRAAARAARVAHAASGPALQQNLLCVLEGERDGRALRRDRHRTDQVRAAHAPTSRSRASYARPRCARSKTPSSAGRTSTRS